MIFQFEISINFLSPDATSARLAWLKSFQWSALLFNMSSELIDWFSIVVCPTGEFFTQMEMSSKLHSVQGKYVLKHLIIISRQRNKIKHWFYQWTKCTTEISTWYFSTSVNSPHRIVQQRTVYYTCHIHHLVQFTAVQWQHSTVHGSTTKE